MDASFLLRVMDNLFRDQTTSTSVLPYSRLDILHTSYFNLYIYIHSIYLPTSECKHVVDTITSLGDDIICYRYVIFSKPRGGMK